jgi:hypothetical protein
LSHSCREQASTRSALLKPTCAQLPHATRSTTLLAIHDDTYVNTKAANELVAVNYSLEEKANSIHLRFVPSKEHILQLPNPTRAADSPNDLDFHRQLIDPTTPFERSFMVPVTRSQSSSSAALPPVNMASTSSASPTARSASSIRRC